MTLLYSARRSGSAGRLSKPPRFAGIVGRFENCVFWGKDFCFFTAQYITKRVNNEPFQTTAVDAECTRTDRLRDGTIEKKSLCLPALRLSQSIIDVHEFPSNLCRTTCKFNRHLPLNVGSITGTGVRFSIVHA